MSSQPPWIIGQRVICINDSFPSAVTDWCDHLPIAGYVYTIRALQIGHNDVNGLSNLGLLLKEIVNPTSSWGCEAGFIHTRFIPWLDVGRESEHGDAVQPQPLQEAQSTN